MHQGHGGAPCKMGIPVFQRGLIRMSGQAADGVYFRRNTDSLTPQSNMLRAIYQGTTCCTPCLEASDQQLAFPAPDIVFEMVLDTPACTHAAACNNDGAPADFIDRHGLVGSARDVQVW